MNSFFLTYVLWISSEIFLNRFVRSGKTDMKAVDKNSELYLWLTILVSVTTGVMIASMYPFPIFSNAHFALIGIFIIILGVIIRFVAIKQLGRFFTVDVTIRQDHQLVQNGFYKFLRHPSYSGSLLSFVGFGFSLNNWASLAIVFLPTFFTFLYRMNIEEDVLTEQFGQHYKDYMRNTKRILPFIY